MNTIGFPKSRKENENRRALIPKHINLIKHPEQLFFETGYGEVLNISDEEYKKYGCHVVSYEETLKQDVICDPKIGDAEYLGDLKNQIIFGWVHAIQNREIAEKIKNSKLTVYAWELMYDRGRHVFWRNNELAGEAAVLHAFQCYGQMPYETKVAIIGRGNTARGAIKVLSMLGADIVQYDRNTEKLLIDEIKQYDVVVNCVLWDISRKDHIISRRDLCKLKKGAMIIDVSCDKNGGIETSVPTRIENPTYVIDGIIHYAVDHTPAIFHKTFSKNNSKIISPYLEQLITNDLSPELKQALLFDNGQMIR